MLYYSHYPFSCAQLSSAVRTLAGMEALCMANMDRTQSWTPNSAIYCLWKVDLSDLGPTRWDPFLAVRTLSNLLVSYSASLSLNLLIYKMTATPFSLNIWPTRRMGLRDFNLLPWGSGD